MIVAEDIAKQMLRRSGLAVPVRIAHTPAEAAAIARELGGCAVVKAIIPAGGRGKAGGVPPLPIRRRSKTATADLLGKELLGQLVPYVLVEEQVPVSRNLRRHCGKHHQRPDRPHLSLSGGVEIENTARDGGGSVHQLAIQPGDLLPVHRLRAWLKNSRLDLSQLSGLAEVLAGLYRVPADFDAILLEINPLALTSDGRLVLLDCKLEVDDNALARQPEFNEIYLAGLSEREQRARQLGVSYVPLDGDIGVITSGAGLGMATLDLLQQRGLAPADFLDTGGGISEELVKGALELVLDASRPWSNYQSVWRD